MVIKGGVGGTPRGCGGNPHYKIDLIFRLLLDDILYADKMDIEQQEYIDKQEQHNIDMEEEEEEEEEIPLMECDNCGNKWDGAAQCNCWGLYFEEEEDESGYESV